MFNHNRLFDSPQKSPLFLIAEIGINHDGKLASAKSAIAAAAEAGADAVKFQIYSIDGFYSQKAAPDAYALFQKLGLSLGDFYALRDYASQKGILCFAAPFSQDVLDDFIKNQIFPIKIASGDALTEPWLDKLLRADAPFIVSTGSLSQEDTKALAQRIRGARAGLLYCVSQYPAPPEAFDLNYLSVLQALLPDQALGFSDHSMGTALSLAAAAKGAKIIERHFTLFPERKDLDHPLSLGPEEFAALNNNIRTIEKALGAGLRANTAEEIRIRPLAARGIYAALPIKKGEIIAEGHLVFLRPGKGVSARRLQSLLGSPALCDYAKGAPINQGEEL